MHKPSDFKNNHRTQILVDRRKALGDVVMITPVIRELRRRYANAEIFVVAEDNGPLYNNPNIDHVLNPADLAKTTNKAWDLYVNLNDAYEENITSHYVDSYLYRAFGHTGLSVDHSPEIFPTEEECNNIDDVLEQIGKNYIVVHMRRWAWENKNIDPDTWNKVFAQIVKQHPEVKIVSIGAQHDYRVPHDPTHYIDLVDQLSIGEIQYLISCAKAFVGPDSGPFHIAGTTATPIVALISHLMPEQILPWRGGEFGKDISVVTSDVSCLGCYARQTPPVRQLDCENPVPWVCSKSFDSKKIFQALDKILQ
jgi:ADP-heptose:LPS heptosyltransferase